MTDSITSIHAHRGSGVPENTLKAFKQAIDLEADYIELDVHLTADKQFIVFHDASLKKLQRSELISELTLVELKEIELASGERMPSLDEVYQLCTGKIGLNIELKSPHGEELADFIKERKWESGVMVSSFKTDELEKIHQILPELDLGYLFVDFWLIPSWRRLKIARKIGASALHPYHRFTYSWRVKRAHKANLEIRPWTINEEKDLHRMFKHKVNAIITDDVKLAQKVRENYQK
ncbi:MAG: glycerophosphodiester phosphodiesterase [Candidatus Kariarchaeaceae archaeon]